MASFFFFQAEDGIRGADVTGVQTCALPISWTSASSASGHAAARGISDATTANAARIDSTSSPAHSAREGRHSVRQREDALDERPELVIGDFLVAHEPAPEPIVLAVQQP